MVEVVFRCDASHEIGAGHVMRCLVLADHLARQGKASLFVCREHQGHCADMIVSSGHEVVLLPLESQGHPSLGGANDTDATHTIEVVQRTEASWLVVDHYSIDARWEQQVKDATAVQIFVIDGQANRPHVCDRLLDPAFSEAGNSRWHGLLPEACKIFSGLRYALLRPEFKRQRINIGTRPKARRGVFRALIGFGGFDAVNATATALEALIDLGRSDLQADVIVGPRNRNLAHLKTLVDGLSWVRLHVAPRNIAEMMAEADCGICAGGTMLVEFCSVLTPAMALIVADNQRDMVKALSKNGLVIDLGHYDPEDPGQTRQKIAQSLADVLTNKINVEAMRLHLKSMIPNDHIAFDELLEARA